MPISYSSISVEADALSTTVFVEDIEKGMQLVEALPNLETIVITRVNEKFASRGWKTA